MIHFYYHPTPNPAKVALFLEETGLPHEVVPVDTGKGEQHAAKFRSVNPNGKVPAIVDTDGFGGAELRVSDSGAILLYLATKTGKLMGAPADHGELLSWIFHIASGLGPFSGQAVHFQRAAPEKLPYAINRYRREAERHYGVLHTHLEGRAFIVRSAPVRSPTFRRGAGSTAQTSCSPAAMTHLLLSRTSNAGSNRSTIGRRSQGRVLWVATTPSSEKSMTNRGEHCTRPIIPNDAAGGVRQHHQIQNCGVGPRSSSCPGPRDRQPASRGDRARLVPCYGGLLCEGAPLPPGVHLG